VGSCFFDFAIPARSSFRSGGTTRREDLVGREACWEGSSLMKLSRLGVGRQTDNILGKTDPGSEEAEERDQKLLYIGEQQVSDTDEGNLSS
jgi:hypothetical protein